VEPSLLVCQLRDDLHNLFISHATCIGLPIGAARLAKNKAFNKKLGREFAEKMIQLAKVDFKNVEIRGTRHVYHFEAWVANNCPNENKLQKDFFRVLYY
jgi:hypothetical protein